MKKIAFFTFALFLFSLSNCSLKFSIPVNREKCFIEQTIFNGSLLIRYDISGFQNLTETEINEVLQNIKIFVKTEETGRSSRYDVESRKGKIAISTVEGQSYRICTKYTNSKTWGVKKPDELSIGLKLSNDWEEINVDQALNKETLGHFQSKIQELKSKVNEPILSQKRTLKMEDKSAREIIKTSRLYFNLTIFQLIFVIGIGMFHLITFRRFLSSNKII